ncbi:MAG TPA: 50S ribosomal protein L11 methyltransferase [Candidatus Polarisedimenticolaceae bacterium]|nr:50S ribosomal protein L11 methyltransferase [Candidatus Polarisedimenticolaceae bacterium]
MTAERSSGDGERSGAAGRPRVWSAVVIELPAALVDEALAIVASDSSGAELGEDGVLRRLAVWFERDEAAEGALARVRRWLSRRGLTADARLERVEDGHWAERYQAGLVPFDLGARFIVDPSGTELDEPRAGVRTYIHLAPGGAFGTGEHPTTRLCVGLLESLVAPGTRWLDLGCGTAILSVVARYLGASRVAAVDLDGEACQVARQVLARNGLSRQVLLWNGSLAELAPDCWDGVVANVELPFFLENSARLGRLPAVGGLLIASGFLGDDARLVALRLGRAGLSPIRIEIDPPWAALAARRVAR